MNWGITLGLMKINSTLSGAAEWLQVMSDKDVVNNAEAWKAGPML